MLIAPNAGSLQRTRIQGQRRVSFQELPIRQASIYTLPMRVQVTSRMPFPLDKEKR